MSVLKQSSWSKDQHTIRKTEAALLPERNKSNNQLKDTKNDRSNNFSREPYLDRGHHAPCRDEKSERYVRADAVEWVFLRFGRGTAH